MIHFFFISVAATLAFGPLIQTRANTNDPAAQLASFKLAPGFEINLFASEANGVVKPIQARFDPEGRMFVACSVIYPQLQPGQKAEDKIILLEDRDEDGQAERSTVFADGLVIPTGLEWGDGGLYVGNGPELLHFKDTNGDGKADVRRVVLRGFGTGDSHQNINSFCWSPGGELMFSQGLHAFSSVETPWGIRRLNEAGIWRFRPRRIELDGFFGHGLAPHNPWGFAFDDWGQGFVVAGNGHGIFYPLPIMIRDHRPIPLPQIWENFRGRKISGADIAGTSHFPESMQGLMLGGGFINNTIFTLKITERASSYTVTDEPPLLTSTHASFRPVDVRFGPDGALYIADWYNPIIGHYQASFRHPDRDRAHGRIWRVTARNRPLTKRPQLTARPVPELLNHLKSSDRWLRYQTRRVLQEADTQTVLKHLEGWRRALSSSDPAFERHLLEALFVAETHEQVEPLLLKQLLAAKDHRARAYAATTLGRWAERLAERTAPREVLELLHAAATDSHPRVRLAAVVSAACLPHAQSAAVAAAALDQPSDEFIEYAFRQAVHALKPQWLPALNSSSIIFGKPSVHLAAILRADGSPDTLRLARELLRGPALDQSMREAFLFSLVEAGGPPEWLELCKEELYQAAADPGALRQAALQKLVDAAKTRPVKIPAETSQPLLEGLLAHPSQAVRASALELAGLWKVQALRPTLAAFLGKEAAPSLRLAAISGLAQYRDAESFSQLSELLAGDPPAAEKVQAIAGMALINLPAAAEQAGKLLAIPVHDAVSTNLASAFLLRADGAKELAKALGKTTPAPENASAVKLFLEAIGRADASLMAVLAPGEKRAWQLEGEPLEAFIREVRDDGNPIAGKSIFQRVDLSCVTCHSIAGEGGTIGPDLNSIGASQPIDFIIGAVLQPNKEVKESFEAVEVTTKSGDSIQGYRLRQEENALVIRDLLQNREIRIGREQIQAVQTRGSIMPPGLVDHLSRQELRDLIRYLSQLGKAPALP